MAHIRNSISGMWLRVDGMDVWRAMMRSLPCTQGVITRREHGMCKMQMLLWKDWHVAVGCLILTTTPSDSAHLPAGLSTSAHLHKMTGQQEPPRCGTSLSAWELQSFKPHTRCIRGTSLLFNDLIVLFSYCILSAYQHVVLVLITHCSYRFPSHFLYVIVVFSLDSP